MFAGWINTMRRFADALPRAHGGSSDQGTVPARRPLLCMELEDRTLLSATPLGVELLVNTELTGVQGTQVESPQSVATDASGNFVVVWTSAGQDGAGGGVYAQRFNSAGVAQGTEFKVNTATADDQTYASVAMDADGDFVVTWTTSAFANAGVRAQRFNAAGVAQGGEIAVNTHTVDSQIWSTVAMDDAGNFVVTWSSINQDGAGWGVYAQRYDSAGVAQGVEFRVNTTTAGDQQYSNVAMDADGDFVITWSSNAQDSDGWGIYSQRYNAAGIAQGGEVRINTTTTGNQHYSSVAMDADGDYVVTWSSENQDSGGWGIYAQRYNASGVAQDDEFRINTTTASDQQYSRIAIDGSGDFVVTWSSNNQDGGGWGVYGRRYSAAGAPQGSEFIINTTTAGNQQYSSIAMDADGDMVAVWSGNGPGDADGVFAQRFDGNYTPFSAQISSGSGLSFDGVDDYVQIGSSASLQMVDKLTLEALINPRDGGSTTQIIINKEGEYELARFADGTIRWAFANTTPGWTWIDTGYVAQAGQWTHIAVVYDAGVVQTYAGGVLVHTYNGLGNIGDQHPAFNDLRIGTRQNAANQHFNGLIDEVRIWNIARTQGDIQTTMNSALTGAESGLVGNWRFNEGTGTTVTDQSAAGNHGTLGGGVAASQPTWVNHTMSEDGTLIIAAPGVILNAGDADLDPLSAILVTDVTSGTLTLNADGSFTYTPDQDFTGSDSFTYKVNDGTADSNTATVIITVAAVNDAPVLDLDANNSNSAGVNYSTSYSEGDSPVLIADSDAAISDVDHANLASLTVTITNLQDGAAELLSADTTGTSIVAAYNSATGVLTLSGADSVAHYQQVVRTLRYSNSSQSPNTTSRTITFVTNDGTANSAAATATVSVSSVNDAPAIDLDANNSNSAGTAFATTHSEGGSSVLVVDSDAVLGDVDHANLASLLVTITDLQDGAAESLSADTTGTSITASYNSATGVLTLSGSDTVAHYQQVLRTIRYANSSENPTAGIRTVEFVASDGSTNSNTATCIVTVSASNDAPVVDLDANNSNSAGANYSTSYNEGDSPVLIADGDATFSDVDDANLVSLTVTITNLQDGAAESLFANTTGTSISASYDSSTGELTLSGSDSVAHYQQVLRTIRYSNSSDDPTAGARTIEFVANDGSANSNVATCQVTVAAVNDAPVNTVPGAQNTSEDTALLFSSGNGNQISIDDLDAGNGQVELTLTATNGQITLAGTAGLSFSTGDGTADTTLVFTGTVADVNAALDGLTFDPTSGYGGAASVQITTSDQGNSGSGGALYDTDTIAITVAGVNDAPVISAPGAQTVNEDTALIFSGAGGNLITISDSDAGAGTLEITLLVSQGTLSLGSASGLTFSTGDGVSDATLVFSGTVADLNTALDGLRFSAGADYAGAVTLQISVDDLGNTGSGGALTANATVNITVDAVNDAPAVTAPSAQVAGSQAVVFSTARGTQIRVSDLEGGTVQVTLTANSGAVTLASTNGLTFVTGDGQADAIVVFNGSVADVNAALDGLQFQTTGESARLQIDVSDLGNSGAGGVRTASTDVSITQTPLIPPPADSGSSTPPDSSAPEESSSEDSDSSESGDSTTVVLPYTPAQNTDSESTSSNESGQRQTEPVRDSATTAAPAMTSFAMQNQGDPDFVASQNERLLKGSSADIDAEIAAANGIDAQNNVAWVYDQIQELAEQLESDTDTTTLAIGTVAGVSALSTGYLMWCLRGGSLLATALSSIPAWGSFDPLPVLDFWDKNSKRRPGTKGVADDDTEAADEETLLSLMS